MNLVGFPRPFRKHSNHRSSTIPQTFTLDSSTIPQTYTSNKTSNRRTSSRSGWPCGNKKSRDFRIQSPDRRRLRRSSAAFNPPFPEREIVRPGPRRQGIGSASLRALDGSGPGLGTRCFMRERGNCNGRENPPGPGFTNERFRNPLASDGLSRVSALQNGIAVEIRWAKGFRNVLPGRDQVIHPKSGELIPEFWHF